MSIRDPFYVKIEEALGTVPLDTDLFERLAAELVQSKGFPTNLAVGGADNGYDFEILDTASEPGPGVVTTSDRVTGNLKRNLVNGQGQGVKSLFLTNSPSSAIFLPWPVPSVFSTKTPTTMSPAEAMLARRSISKTLTGLPS